MRLLILTAIIGLAFACQTTPKGSEKSVEEIKQEGAISNSDIVRNPVSASKPEDTVNVAKMTFEEDTYDLGQVKAGEKVAHVYNFTNTGKAPLLITSARSTCGCTVPEWPKDPIPPGGKGELKVVFNSEGKHGQQNKPVTVLANTYPGTTKVFLTGTVVGEGD